MAEPKKEFRMQYKTFGLTYSKCNYTKQEILDHIKTKAQVNDYYIVREDHDPKKPDYDPKYPYHIHAWFNVLNKPNFRGHDYFNINGLRCNIGNKKLSWVYNYLKNNPKKICDKDPLTNIPLTYVELALNGDYEGAVKRFINSHPKDYLIHKDRIETNIRKLSRKRKRVHIFKDDGRFKDVEQGWDQKKSLLLVGPSGVGKTEWAKTFMHKLNKSFIMINHLDGLKRYNDEDCIIFDDMNFSHLPRTSAIHIAETINPQDIHCRHSIAHLPGGIIKIFTSNYQDIFPPDPAGAISRRLQVWLLE